MLDTSTCCFLGDEASWHGGPSLPPAFRCCLLTHDRGASGWSAPPLACSFASQRLANYSLQDAIEIPVARRGSSDRILQIIMSYLSASTALLHASDLNIYACIYFKQYYEKIVLLLTYFLFKVLELSNF